MGHASECCCAAWYPNSSVATAVSDPTLVEALTGEPFSLSDAYISRNARRPSLMAVQHVVDDDGNLKGYLGADFDLRAGSLNIFNGMVGLNFSCNGSHYMPWAEFLDKSLEFWLGTSDPVAM